jgi:alkylated DNA repair dioxygenase AlkB
VVKPTYLEAFIGEADEILKQLLLLDWLDVTEARREYFMSDEPRTYAYGKGVNIRHYASNPYSPLVETIQASLNDIFKASFNVCFLNRYDHQRQHLGWHADDSPEMDREHPIAVVSFGAEREIWWKLQGAKGDVPSENRQKLGHGSLFMMPAGFQDLYFHKIPKCDRECGIRVSLTFRRYVGQTGE